MVVEGFHHRGTEDTERSATMSRKNEVGGRFERALERAVRRIAREEIDRKLDWQFETLMRDIADHKRYHAEIRRRLSGLGHCAKGGAA